MTSTKIIAFALGPISTAALAFMTLPVLAWLFAPEDIGRITLLQVTLSFSFAFIGLSLEQAYAREFYEHRNTPALLKTTFLPGLIIATASMVFLLFTQVDVSYLLFGEPDFYISLLVYGCILNHFIISYSSLILRMNGNGLAYSTVMLSPKLIFLTSILLVFVYGNDKDFRLLIALHTASLTLTLVAALYLTRKDWNEAFRAAFLHNEFSKYLRFSTPLIFGSLAYWGLTAVDKISIRWWSDFDQLGIFSVAVSFAGIATLFQTIFTTVWTPFIYKWNSQGLDMGKLSEITNHVLAMVVFIYALVGSLSWLVKYLLPEEYSLVPYIIPACIGAPLLYMLSETTVVGTHLTRKTFFAMLAPLVALIVNLILNFCLVPTYGAAGAAASTGIAFFVFLVMRTELSVFLWKRFPRLKIYFFSFLCVATSSIEAIFHNQIGASIFFIWVGILTLALVAFKSTLTALIDLIRNQYANLKHRNTTTTIH